MAYIRKDKGHWRAEVERKGVPTSRTRISGRKDLRMLLDAYYRESIGDIAAQSQADCRCLSGPHADVEFGPMLRANRPSRA